MKIIQTFWTGNFEGTDYLNFTSGWSSPEYHWISWALSCLSLRRCYDQVELFTDMAGKNVLIDIMGLPYTKVHIVFDESFKVRPELFSLAKIKTYGLQNEPFIHVDGDIYIWKPFPERLISGGLIASNLEKNLFFNREILEAVHKHFGLIPYHLVDVHNKPDIYACNAGILGGNNLKIIRKYCNLANSFIQDNLNDLDKVNVGNLNWMIEQISLYYLALQEDVPVSYLIEKPVTNPLYEDFWRFSDVPFVDLVHPVGGCKREAYVLRHLSRRLRLEFPTFYYRIINEFLKRNFKLDSLSYYNLNVEAPEGKSEHRSQGFNRKEKSHLFPHASTSFKSIFGRTLHFIAEHYKEHITDLSSLEYFVKVQQTKAESTKLSEVFALDNLKNAMMTRLIDSSPENIQKLYAKDENNYKTTAGFFMDASWMYREIKLADGVKLVEQVEDGQSTTRNDQNNLNYITSLSPNVLNLEIAEMRHDGFDAVLLKEVKEGSIFSLAQSLTTYFDEDVSVDNHQFQRLLFETIKRMAFENIVEIR
jgi:hypothetical protein